eukprot:snap_masked-scaffold_75-processed-gene-0.25-mRNA-1 protein AED:1.00 eAED:1.00 QI:0/-1/0/0/-1/1/1/0/185
MQTNKETDTLVKIEDINNIDQTISKTENKTTCLGFSAITIVLLFVLFTAGSYGIAVAATGSGTVGFFSASSSIKPTSSPTLTPSVSPSLSPSPHPINSPTNSPTRNPSEAPSSFALNICIENPASGVNVFMCLEDEFFVRCSTSGDAELGQCDVACGCTKNEFFFVSSLDDICEDPDCFDPVNIG